MEEGQAKAADAQAREALSVLHEISEALNTGLDRETLSILVSLCEAGVNPEALAMVVCELRRPVATTEGIDRC
ncbi:Mitotic-spindle organizing protein 1 [Plasmodiophora brassicae]